MRLSVLIAEGDSGLRDAYADFFRRTDFHVETAAGGVECLEKIRLCRPDVLLIDDELNWGGAEGVLAQLIEQKSLPYVPVVLATGERPPAELSASLGLPATHCFRKPFRMHRLLECIESAVLRFHGQIALRTDATCGAMLRERVAAPWRCRSRPACVRPNLDGTGCRRAGELQGDGCFGGELQ